MFAHAASLLNPPDPPDAGPTDSPDVLPFASNVVALKVEHVQASHGWETIIGRVVADPSDCRNCPGGRGCKDGGFCLVRVQGYIPLDSCAGFILEAPDASAEGGQLHIADLADVADVDRLD